MMPSTKIDEGWPPVLKIQISLNDISLATDQYIISSGEQIRALGPSCLIIFFAGKI